MIEIDRSGIERFRRELRLEMARLDREISIAYFKWTVRVFSGLLQDSPQWSGDLTANWNYSVSKPDFSYTRVPNKTGDDGRIDHWRQNQGVFERGHQLAIQDAMNRMQSVPMPTWRDTVFISNATPHDAGGYLVDAIESGQVKLRPVNLVQGQAVLIKQTVLRESMRAL